MVFFPLLLFLKFELRCISYCFPHELVFACCDVILFPLSLFVCFPCNRDGLFLGCYWAIVMVATHSSFHFLHFPVISAVTCFALSLLVYVASRCDCCVLLLFHVSWKKFLIFSLTVETWLCREDREGPLRIEERNMEFPSGSFASYSATRKEESEFFPYSRAFLEGLFS